MHSVTARPASRAKLSSWRRPLQQLNGPDFRQKQEGLPFTAGSPTDLAKAKNPLLHATLPREASPHMNAEMAPGSPLAAPLPGVWATL